MGGQSLELSYYYALFVKWQNVFKLLGEIEYQDYLANIRQQAELWRSGDQSSTYAEGGGGGGVGGGDVGGGDVGGAPGGSGGGLIPAPVFLAVAAPAPHLGTLAEWPPAVWVQGRWEACPMIRFLDLIPTRPQPLLMKQLGH